MEFIVPLITLIIIEVILGMDNVIFISILANKQHASFKILTLCFLMMIGVSLLGEGF